MGEVRPRRSGLRREVRPAAARRQHASGGRELAPRRPRGQRGTARAAGLRLTAARCGSTSTRSGRSVGACRGATAPVAGLSGNAGARGGTRRRFPRRRPAAPLLSPLDATTGATSTSSGARPAMRRRPALPRTLRAEGWARAPSAVSRVFLRRSARGVVRRAQGAGEQRRRAAERASRGPLRLSPQRTALMRPRPSLPLVASPCALRSRWSLRPTPCAPRSRWSLRTDDPEMIRRGAIRRRGYVAPWAAATNGSVCVAPGSVSALLADRIPSRRA